MSALYTRTQPWEIICPRSAGFGVPWIAMRPPPGQSFRTGEKPERPSAKMPYGPVGLACGTCAHT